MTTSTFDLETKAEDRGRIGTILNNLVIDVAEVRRDVHRLTWIAVPAACVALVLSIVALTIALQVAYLLLSARAGLAERESPLAPAGQAARIVAATPALKLPFSSPPHQLVPTAQAIARSIAWRGPSPGAVYRNCS